MGPLSHLWATASLIITLSFREKSQREATILEATSSVKHWHLRRISRLPEDRGCVGATIWHANIYTIDIEPCIHTNKHMIMIFVAFSLEIFSLEIFTQNVTMTLQFCSFRGLPLAYKWFLHKFLKEKFCQNSTCWILHVLFTLYLKFMNNYRREARFDFSKCKSSQGLWGDCAEPLKWGKGNKEQQRAEESPILLIVLVLAVAL